MDNKKKYYRGVLVQLEASLKDIEAGRIKKVTV